MNYGQGSDPAESGELNFIKRIVVPKFQLSQTKVAFDVGANRGDYSRLLAAHLPASSHIYSFEPQAAAYRLLSSLIKEYNLSNVKPFQLGLSKVAGSKTLYKDQEGSVLASVYQRKLDHFGVRMNSSEEIRVETIDHFCEMHTISTIDFLKLDVEGHELEVFHGARRMLQNKRIDIIQWEFGGCNIDSRTFFRDFYYLLKDDYVICRLLPAGIHPIKTYKETYEIFITTNWCAISKAVIESDVFPDYLHKRLKA